MDLLFNPKLNFNSELIGLTFFLKTKNKKTLWSLFMDGIQLSQGHHATTRNSFLSTTKSTEIPDTQLIGLGRMEGWADLKAIQWLWTRNSGLKISALTTRARLYKEYRCTKTKFKFWVPSFRAFYRWSWSTS